MTDRDLVNIVVPVNMVSCQTCKCKESDTRCQYINEVRELYIITMSEPARGLQANLHTHRTHKVKPH